MLKASILSVALAWAGGAAAGDQPIYAPPPAWVKPLPIPHAATNGGTVAAQVLLENYQAFLGPTSDQFYSETATKVLSPQALGGVGNLSLSWNPETETVTIHKLNIVRGDNVIDVLAGGKRFTILRRESNLELAMLDGTLTATIQPEGLQVGDIVDLAITFERHDPVFQGRSEGATTLYPSGVVAHAHFSAIWPNNKPVRWLATDGLGTPLITKTTDQTQLLIDMTNVEAPKPPEGAPPRFSRVGQLQLTQFAGWDEVAALMTPLYAKASTLKGGSAVDVEIEKIKALTNDPKSRAAAALRLVEDQTRYVFLGMNFGGYVPADADVTWARRFGDCKGKTALLLAILRKLGIEAQPALVSTTGGDGLDERLPVLGVFDHVMVRAVIGGKTYWLDGTRLGDRDLDKLSPPSFHYVLPVQAAGAKLEKIEQPPLSEPATEYLLRVDASAGLDSPAPAHVEALYRGEEAIERRLQFNAMNRADTDRYMRELWRKSYPWIEARQVDSAYDEIRNVMRLTMDGSATVDWSKYGAFREFDIGDSSLGWTTSYRREPGPHQDAPFAVNHPTYVRWLAKITLPQHGYGFSLVNATDVDTTVAGTEFKRISRIDDGVVTMDATQRSTEAEFPADQADKAAAKLHELVKTDVVVRSPSLIAETQTSLDAGSLPPPVDAAGFSRRGVVFLANRDYDNAIADFSKAAQLDPRNSKHLYNRGVARFEANQLAAAVYDFDLALRLEPEDPLALLARGMANLRLNDEVHARRDFNDAIRLAPNDTNVLLRRARAYGQTGRFGAAVADLDDLITTHPADPRLGEMLFDRCIFASRWSEQPQRAAQDCDAAVKVRPGNQALLEARGLIRLRLGEVNDALSDFDAAVRVGPSSAFALFGRAVAESRKGMKHAADTDLAGSLAANPKVVAYFESMGFKP